LHLNEKVFVTLIELELVQRRSVLDACLNAEEWLKQENQESQKKRQITRAQNMYFEVYVTVLIMYY